MKSKVCPAKCAAAHFQAAFSRLRQLMFAPTVQHPARLRQNIATMASPTPKSPRLLILLSKKAISSGASGSLLSALVIAAVVSGREDTATDEFGYQVGQFEFKASQ